MAKRQRPPRGKAAKAEAKAAKKAGVGKQPQKTGAVAPLANANRRDGRPKKAPAPETPEKAMKGGDKKAPAKKGSKGDAGTKGAKPKGDSKGPEKPGFKERVGINPEDEGVVFVSNLDVNTTEEELKTCIASYAKVEDVVFIKPKGVFKGSAFVKLGSESEKIRVLEKENRARDLMGLTNYTESVSFSGVGFSINGRGIRIKDSMKKDELDKELIDRKVKTKNPRRLFLINAGEIPLDDPMMKEFTKEFRAKYITNYKNKRQKIANVNCHVSDRRIRIGNCPQGLDNTKVKDAIIKLLLSTDEGMHTLLHSSASIRSRGKIDDKPLPEFNGEQITKNYVKEVQSKMTGGNAKTVGVKMLSHQSFKTVLCLFETRTEKQKNHDAAQRNKFVKGRFTGSVFIEFYSHHVAKYIVEKLAFRQGFFAGTKHRLITEFAIEDKNKAKIHDMKKENRDKKVKSKKRH